MRMPPVRWVLALAALLPAPAGAQAVDPAEHWPLPPRILEQRLAREPFEILSARGGVGGVMGVKKLAVRFPARGEEFAVKWKEAPPLTLDGWNNSPRKEIAAYRIQQWFLDPPDYVVPTAAPRCIALDAYTRLDPDPEPSLEGTRCVFGTLVVWLEKVTVPERLFDEERFAADPRYARHLANLNLLTYLIAHEDGREGNFLVSEIESERRAFSIDNGVAFGVWVKNIFVRNWNRIRVPKLSASAIERLRQVSSAEIEALGVVAELRADDAGQLVPVAASPDADPEHGARIGKGWVQLGLTAKERAGLRERLDRLLARVDAHEIETF